MVKYLLLLESGAFAWRRLVLDAPKARLGRHYLGELAGVPTGRRLPVERGANGGQPNGRLAGVGGQKWLGAEQHGQ